MKYILNVVKLVLLTGVLFGLTDIAMAGVAEAVDTAAAGTEFAAGAIKVGEVGTYIMGFVIVGAIFGYVIGMMR